MTGQVLTQRVVADRRLEAQTSVWFTSAFRAEALTGLKLATRGRLVSLAVIAVLLLYLVPTPAIYYFEAIVVVFVIIGVAHYVLSHSRFDQPWLNYPDCNGFCLASTVDMLMVGLSHMAPTRRSLPGYAQTSPRLTRKTTPFDPRDVSHALVLATRGPRMTRSGRTSAAPGPEICRKTRYRVRERPTRGGLGRPVPGPAAAARRRA